jgi:cytochrome P450
VTAPFIDTLDPGYDRDIHAAHAAAREKSWYARTPYGILLLGYDDVHACLRDRRWHELGAAALAGAGISEGPLWDWFHQILSNKEGAEHSRLRRLVSQAFTPRSVERLRPVMREQANEFVDRIAGAGRCEFVAGFAAGYPVRVIGALLGVPPGDFARFHAWSTDLSLAFGSRIAEERPRIETALGNLCDYVDHLLAERRRAPHDDLISGLLAVEEAGDRLSPDELRAMITVLIFGGQDTTQCQLTCAVATFAAHPDQWDRLAREPQLAASAAEEVLRYEPAGSGRRASRSSRSRTKSSRSRRAPWRCRRVPPPTAIPPSTRIPIASTSRAATASPCSPSAGASTTASAPRSRGRRSRRRCRSSRGACAASRSTAGRPGVTAR